MRVDRVLRVYFGFDYELYRICGYSYVVLMLEGGCSYCFDWIDFDGDGEELRS